MCLKKFVTYTFSNRDAFDRVVKIIEEDYGEYLPKGVVYKILAYRDWGTEVKVKINDLSYEEKLEYLEMFYAPFKQWDDITFHNWDEWRAMLKEVGDYIDIFGTVTIELV